MVEEKDDPSRIIPLGLAWPDPERIRRAQTGSPPDTIVAPASGAGPAAIAVIRVSGPQTREVLRTICGGIPDFRRATLRAIGPPQGPMIDRGLVLWFPAPGSFTGEDMAEIHVHGSRVVVQEVIEAVLSLDGLRLAEPGEFAGRAFINGKLDLRQIEGLADLINAETRCQREQALQQAEGLASERYGNWRGGLVKAQLLVEAVLDFADEDDVTVEALDAAEATAKALLADLEDALKRGGERLRSGLRIVIAGAPNAGKSSLLNAIAKRDVAIVSEEAGTTRDVIEVHLDLGGLPVTLTDTAGLREAQGKVEAEGIRRALSRAEDADVVMWIADATAPVWQPPDRLSAKRCVLVLNKVDVAPDAASSKDGLGAGCIPVSAKTGQGLERLIEALEEEAALATESGAGSPLVTRARHRVELEGACEALRRFCAGPAALELKAEELRIAARHLGRLTGEVDAEEILGAIFAEFCIGK